MAPTIAIEHGADIEMIRAALAANRDLAGDGVNWPPAQYADGGMPPGDFLLVHLPKTEPSAA